MRPLRNQLLVIEVAKAEDSNMSSGGIILRDDKDKGSSQPGCVVAVGDEVEFVKLEDQVALEWNKGLPVTVAGTKCILISEEFIRGIYGD